MHLRIQLRRGSNDQPTPCHAVAGHCCSPRFCSSVISTGCSVAIHRRYTVAAMYDERHLAPGWNTLVPLLRTSQLASRKPRSSSPNRSSTKSTKGVMAPAALEKGGDMEANTHRCHSRDGSAMAPSRLPAILACDLQGSASNLQEKDFQRGTGSHLPSGDREPDLGRTTRSRRVSHARCRYLRTNHFPLDA